MPGDPAHDHRRSIRLRDYDYSGAGWYFLTLCAHDRIPLFGTVTDGDIRLNTLGQIVAAKWEYSAQVRPEILLDESVVMPNHLHAIVALGTDPDQPTLPIMTTSSDGALSRLPRSLGSLVGGFKAATTSSIRSQPGDPAFLVWQRNYFEHVIRSDAALARIRNYIWTNPLRWHLDRNNRDSLGDDAFDLWLDRHPQPR